MTSAHFWCLSAFEFKLWYRTAQVFEYNLEMDFIYEESLSPDKIIDFSLKGLTDLSDKIYYIVKSLFEPATSCVKTKMLPQRRQDTGTASLNWAQFMLHWFITFPEFAEFTEFPINSEKTPMFTLYTDMELICTRNLASYWKRN